MLSPQLRRKVHDLWSLFWSSGLSNPLVAIEQITYLLFIRQLEALDRERTAAGKPSIYRWTAQEEEQYKRQAATMAAVLKHSSTSALDRLRRERGFDRCRWSYIRQNPSFELLNDTVFPWLRGLEDRLGETQNGDATLGRISGRLKDAYFVLDPNKTDTLKRSVSLIDDLFRQLDSRSVNSDIMGDIFEYLLEEVKESGKNGQFRTPRHVIRFMVQLLQPELGSSVLDPACGSGGFLINTLVQWKADHTDKDTLRLEWDGTPHDVQYHVWPENRQYDFSTVFRGYDNDRTMVRIAWMNLVLHNLDSPEVHQLDALSKSLRGKESGHYRYILANPPFTGSVDADDLSDQAGRFPRKGRGNAPETLKSELLFVWLMLDLLENGGRAAVIVPDGVLFGGTNAHRALRRQLLFDNTLEGVVSLPANIFQPYSGVKTSILLFQKAGQPIEKGDEPRTPEVWFYEVTDEAYSLDQKRKALPGRDNDLWDALIKFRAWREYREGDAELDHRDAAVANAYHQPDYWEERWRAVDDDLLRIFPDQDGNKGRPWALHDLWPADFPFDTTDPRGARQYDDAILAKVRPRFEQTFQTLVQASVRWSYANADEPDQKTAIAEAEKAAKRLAGQLTRRPRAGQTEDDTGEPAAQDPLDREFDQFGLNALKALLKEISAKVSDWAAAVPLPDDSPPAGSDAASGSDPQQPDTDQALAELTPLLSEFAKLDGYNVWRRGNDILPRPGKLTAADDGQPERKPIQQSWIIPVRVWAQRDTWGTDPETKAPIDKSTHKDGLVDPDYVHWLRDTLEVFDDEDGTVKKPFLDRLDPKCLEALDFNLSAGRHAPFTLDAGTHREPAEIITELQDVHAQIQGRLERLLTLVGTH